MKIKNTLELKAKFFALYWGQELIWNELGHWKGEPINHNSMNLLSVGNPYLELTPLSQITDEDAIFVYNFIRGIYSGNTHIAERSFRNNILHLKATNIKYEPALVPEIYIDINRLHLEISDYLRSKGYALPWMGISVETLVGGGWVKLKE